MTGPFRRAAPPAEARATPDAEPTVKTPAQTWKRGPDSPPKGEEIPNCGGALDGGGHDSDR
jgi:hypothetical protein